MEAGLEVAFHLPEKGLPFGSRFAIGDEKVGAFFMAKVASVKGGGAGVFRFVGGKRLVDGVGIDCEMPSEVSERIVIGFQTTVQEEAGVGAGSAPEIRFWV